MHINWNTIDWSILSRSRCPPCCYRPGPEIKQSGYLRILPWQHLSSSRRPERNTSYRQAAVILSFETCCLGEFFLVLELGHEP
jgi:hypothetical protein